MPSENTPSSFVVSGARVFDGEFVLDGVDVAVEHGIITAVGPGLAGDGVAVIDGAGATLLPGLIDCHTHPTGPALELAILFGVTTEIDMFTVPERIGDQRERAAQRNDLADIRSASTGATVLGGHPSMLIGLSFREQFPVVSGVQDAQQFVADRVAEGADFIKMLIDDGAALGHSGPSLTEDVARAIADEAHARGLLVVAHATSLENTLAAIRAGVDGLVHVFMDQPPTDEAVAAIKASGTFVVATLVTMGSMAGDLTGASVADDRRARDFIPDDWHSNLCTCWQLGTPSSLDNALLATRALHAAGVPILAGTDAADIGVLGTAHGVSLHQELALLVQSGLSPVEALAAATSVAAANFRLPDRGRIAPGLQAALLLVDGDPTETIGDSLSIRAVWRRGEQLQRVSVRDFQTPSPLGQP